MIKAGTTSPSAEVSIRGIAMFI